MKRERDRISAQLDTLTQECGEARDVAQSQEHQLQEKLKQCQTRSGSVDGELSKCRSSLMEATGVESQCNSEVSPSGVGGGSEAGGMDGELSKCRSSLMEARISVQ